MTTTINLTIPHFAAIVTGVGACVVDALEQTPAGAPTRQCLMLPTQVIPWDNCDCGGQLALAVRNVWGSGTFPQAATVADWLHCGPKFVVAEVVVSVTRCVTGIDQNGQPPLCSVALLEAFTLENDRTATRQAIACCLKAFKDARPPTFKVAAWSLGESKTVGEQGACAGSETVFLVGVAGCTCPDPGIL